MKKYPMMVESTFIHCRIITTPDELMRVYNELLTNGHSEVYLSEYEKIDFYTPEYKRKINAKPRKRNAKVHKR